MGTPCYCCLLPCMTDIKIPLFLFPHSSVHACETLPGPWPAALAESPRTEWVMEAQLPSRPCRGPGRAQLWAVSGTVALLSPLCRQGPCCQSSP